MLLVLHLDLSICVVNEGVKPLCLWERSLSWCRASLLCGLGGKGSRKKVLGPVVTEPVGLALSTLQLKGVKLQRLTLACSSALWTHLDHVSRHPKQG